MVCEYCGWPLPYCFGSRGEGCHVKHGCLGEVRAYLGAMSSDDRIGTLAGAAAKLRFGQFNPFERYSLLGYSQPVNWAQCGAWFRKVWDGGHYQWQQ